MGLLSRIKEKIRLLQVNPSEAEVVFIISTGRTGTQFFERFFQSLFPDVLCFHEPQPDLFEIGMSKYRSAGKNQIPELLRFQRLEQLGTFRKEKKSLYVESNPNAFCLVPEIRQAFPKVRFVRIVRDPRTYMTSAYSKSPTGDQLRFFYGDNDGRKRLTPFDINDQKIMDKWAEFGRFERIAWFWNACNRIMRDDLGDGKDYITLSFEKIFNKDNSFASMQEMVNFLGLDPNSLDPQKLHEVMGEKANQTVEQMLAPSTDWTEEQKRAFNELTEEMRNEFNYPKTT
jgi:hypothetical protein